MLVPEPTELGRAILSRTDVAQLEAARRRLGDGQPLGARRAAVEAGLTSPAEVRRVLGISEADPDASSSAC